jgi:O-antigen/teichoic acid export membrane protein
MSKINSSSDENEKNKVNSYFRYLTKGIFGISLFFSVIIILLSGSISDFLVEDRNYYFYIVIIFLAAPFTVLYSISEAFLRSFQKIDKIVKINVLTNIITTLFLIPLIFFFKYIGVSFYFFLYGVVPFLLLFFVVRKFILELFRKKGPVLTKEDKMIIFKVGSISLLSSLLHQGAIILIRKLLIVNYGYEQNGVYQSVLSISVNYFGLLYIFLTNYTLPKLSFSEDDTATNNELNINTRFLLLIMIPMVLIFYGLKDFSILLLFNKNFISARTLFFPQFIGDIFRVGAALFGLWLIPRRKIKQIILIDAVFNIVLIVLTFTFTGILKLPLFYVSVAYMLAFTLHFVMYYLYTRFALKFRFDKKVLKIFFYSIIALLISFIITENIKDFALLLVLLVLVIWFFVVVEKDEKSKIKLYLSSAVFTKKM